MLSTKQQHATRKDYEALPEGAPYQLIGGELIMSPSANFFHQRIISRLDRTLGNFVGARHLGEIIVAPMDVFLTEDDAYQPDIIFLRQDQLSTIDPLGRIHFAPDHVIEVLSPSTAYYDYSRKKAIYCERGVKEYWIVDPLDETIEIVRNDGKVFQTEALLRKPAILESAMFPGFQMNIEDVFAK